MTQDELNKNNITETPGVGEDNAQYIEAINQLKMSTVEKSKYDKLKEENQQLLNSIVNGNTHVETKPRATIDELREKLYVTGTKNNLEYVEKTLELRDALMESGERDPFLPRGHQYVPSEEDYVMAERTAEVLRDCVEYADGDSLVFTNELNRRMVDVAPRRRV